MQKTYQHILSLTLVVTILLSSILPVTALTPEFGEIELQESLFGAVAPAYPNLLMGEDEAQRDRIWSYLKVENSPTEQTMTIPAGGSEQRMNLLFLKTDTTYVLSGRVKGGAPDLYFEPGCITHVNSSTAGWKYPAVAEADWTPFRYVFTTGSKRPNGGDFYWMSFGNKDGTTSAYWDSLSVQKLTLVDLALSDFNWNNGENPTTERAGKQFRNFSVTVTNNGTEHLPVGEGFVVDVCIDATNVIATLPWYRGLAIGESVTLTNDYDVWTAVEGDHALTAYLRTDSVYHTYERTQKTEDNHIFHNVRVADEDLVAPNIATEYGFTELTFSDDFNSLGSIDVNATGKAGYKWYVTRPYGEKVQVEGRDFSVANGVLTIHTDDTRWAYSLATIDIRKMVGFAFNKGYLECRIRVPISGDEGWDSDDTWKDDPNNDTVRNPGIWAYPTKTLWEDANGERNVSNVEMDWMEYHGTKYLATFGTTLHERRSELVDVVDEEGNVIGTEWKQTWHTTSGNSAFDEIGSEHAGNQNSQEGFHLLSCIWDEGFVRMYVDNELKFTIGYQEDDYPSDRTSSYEQKPQVGSMTEMNTQFLPIILGASEEFQMEVDYVRVWQKPRDYVPQQVDFTLSEKRVTLSTKEKAYLHAVDADGNIVTGLQWQSSDKSVASVYDDGLLVAIGKGATVIQVSDELGNTELCTVIVDGYGNLVTEGDFEGRLEYTMFQKLLFDANTKTSVGVLETAGGNTYMKIPSQSTERFQYINGVPLQAGKTYSYSFRYKGQPTMQIYDQNNYIVDGLYDGGTSYGTRLKLDKATNWTTVTKMFRVEDTVTNNYGNLESATLGFANTSGADAYIDDISVVEVKPSTTVQTQVVGGGTLTVSKTTGITPGEWLTVSAVPQSGYILQSGSLTYTTQDGKTYPILNGAGFASLYGGPGREFMFAAPLGATTVQATFVSVTENNYQFATAGTSLRRKDGALTGVRFLNRLYIDGMDLSQDNLYVIHEGRRQMVTKIGVLLSNGTHDSLTLEDYAAYQSGNREQRVWHALSYGGPNSKLSVLAYTDSYLDFQISLLLSKPADAEFINRAYTVCGYIELEDGTIVYTTPLCDSTISALTREAAVT